MFLFDVFVNRIDMLRELYPKHLIVCVLGHAPTELFLCVKLGAGGGFQWRNKTQSHHAKDNVSLSVLPFPKIAKWCNCFDGGFDKYNLLLHVTILLYLNMNLTVSRKSRLVSVNTLRGLLLFFDFSFSIFSFFLSSTSLAFMSTSSSFLLVTLSGISDI